MHEQRRHRCEVRPADTIEAERDIVSRRERRGAHVPRQVRRTDHPSEVTRGGDALHILGLPLSVGPAVGGQHEQTSACTT